MGGAQGNTDNMEDNISLRGVSHNNIELNLLLINFSMEYCRRQDT